MNPSFPSCSIDANRPAIVIDGVRHPPMAYTSYFPRTVYYRQAAECGIHLYCFPAYLAGRGINTRSGIGPFRTGLWHGPAQFDFADIVTDVEALLAADSSALFIMRLHLDVPEWWERAFPNECCLLGDGSVFRQSFTSPRWRQDAAGALRAVIRWFRTSPYAAHLAGIHVAAGQTEEWLYHACADRNPSRLAAFERWLTERYENRETALRAWSRSDCRDARTALDALEQEPQPRWRDADTDRPALDACRFHSEVMVDAIAAFCRTVKEESDGRLLTGAFYGYHFFVSDIRMGHAALSRLLACPDLDFLASPNMYDRSPGKDWPPMAAVDSVRLHGKLWMAENDTRTALTRPLAETAPSICPAGQYRGGVWKGPDSLELSAALLRTNTARMLTHGYGGWWFDMWGGWFAHPALLAELAAAQTLWRQDNESSDARIVPSHTLCVIVDERFADFDASFGGLCGALIENYRALSTCGRPYVLYLRNDLEELDLSGVRFLWMLGMAVLTAREQERLQQLMREGCTVLHTDFVASKCLGRETQPMGLTLSASDLRALADRSGVHRYLDTDDVLYVGRGYVAIHASEGGEKRLRFPERRTLRQILPFEIDMGTSAEFRFFMAAYETRVFRLS